MKGSGQMMRVVWKGRMAEKRERRDGRKEGGDKVRRRENMG